MKGRKCTLWGVVACLVLFLALPVHGELIHSMQASFEMGGLVYDATTSQFLPWNDEFSLGTIDTGTGTYYVGAGEVVLTSPAELVSDLSSGGVAKGLFGSDGVTLEISGTLYDDSFNEISSGVLITAQATDDFQVNEQPTDPAKILTAQIFFDVVGGEFLTGSVSGLTLDSFWGDFTFYMCEQPDHIPGKAVEDFDSDIDYADGRLLINQVPEPASMILLGLGSVAVLGRKKRSL